MGTGRKRRSDYDVSREPVTHRFGRVLGRPRVWEGTRWGILLWASLGRPSRRERVPKRGVCAARGGVLSLSKPSFFGFRPASPREDARPRGNGRAGGGRTGRGRIVEERGQHDGARMARYGHLSQLMSGRRGLLVEQAAHAAEAAAATRATASRAATTHRAASWRLRGQAAAKVTATAAYHAANGCQRDGIRHHRAGANRVHRLGSG